MRSIWTAAQGLWPLLTLTATYARVQAEQAAEAQSVTVLEYSPSTAYTKFALHCPGCFVGEDGADDSLVFDLQVNPSEDIWTSNVVVNSVALDITWRDTLSQSAQVISIPDCTGIQHSVKLSWIGTVGSPPPSLFKDDDVTQNIHFYATPVHVVDDKLSPPVGFVAIMRPTADERLVGLLPDSGTELIDFESLDEVSISGSPTFEYGGYESDASSETETFDLGTELEALHLLEGKAREIQMQITEKKAAISANLKQEREKLCLKHLIQECDGIMCAAKAIAQRLCDKVGVSTKPSFQYTNLRTQQTQNAPSFNAKVNSQHPHWHECPEGVHCHQSANIPLILTKNSTAAYSVQAIDLIDPPNPLMRVLQIIGAALGITALFAFLKRRCMSMRKRVERAADLEQRRNERAYRRAARRAMMRKRWDRFVGTVNCFGRKEEPRIEDYEEKRALILQDAFLEQDLDAAEKGEIMEAEIRELRYAHEIVSSLVRVDEHRFDLVTPVNDPPPPLVPLPQTPGPRSRASTYTLPSYTSESLPDYTSRIGGSDSSNSLVNGYTPSTSDEERRRSSPSRMSNSSSSRTRYTPTSSIRETSPRPSEETIQTRPSRDSRE